MASKRELYCRWLGRDQLPGQLDHYGLLGIQRQHATPTAVTQRAKQLLSHVRQHDPGTFRPLWLELQRRIAAAHKCLVDPKAKAAYDAQLAPPRTPGKRALPPTVLPPTSKLSLSRKTVTPKTDPSPDSDVAPDDSSSPSRVPTYLPVVRTSRVAQVARRRHRNATVGCLLSVLSSVGVLGITGLLALLYLDHETPPNDRPRWTLRNPIPGIRQPISNTRDDRPRAPFSRPGATALNPSEAGASNIDSPPRLISYPDDPVPDPQVGHGIDREITPTMTRDDEVEPLIPPVRQPPAAPSDDWVSVGLFTKRDAQVLGEALTRARSNLGLRKWATIQPHLDRAKKHAQLASHRQKVARLQRLHFYVTEFWKAVQDGIGTLDGGMEFQVKDSVVIVVEATEDMLVLRANGSNHKFLLNELPGKLALVLADQWFDQDATSTSLIKGAFMAVDPSFDKADAVDMIRSVPKSNQDMQDVLQAVDDSYGFEEDVTGE